MRVIHFVPYYPPERLGGVGVFVARLHQALREAGHESLVVTTGTLAGEEGVRRIARGPLGWFAKVAFWAREARRWDVVHCQSGEALPLVLALALMPRRAKILATFHVSYVGMNASLAPYSFEGRTYARGARGWLARHLNALAHRIVDAVTIRAADAVNTISVASARDVLGPGGEEKAEIVYYGVAPLPGPVETAGVEPVELLYVGAPGHRKRVNVLPFVLEEVRREHPEARLRIVGFELESQRELEGLFAERGLLGHVVTEGFKRPEELPPYYSSSRALIVPSAYEGLPLVILEAMQCGLPVVATRVSGHPEAIVDGENGFLVDLDQPRQIVGRCRELLDDPELGRRLGEAARRTIEERFSIERHLAAYLDLYRRLDEGKPNRGAAPSPMPPRPAGGVPAPRAASRRRPIRILMMISDLGGGGAERQLSILARHLSRERFAPEICIWREVFKYELPDDLPIHLLSKTRWWHLARVLRGTRELVDRLRPDLVYSQLHYVNMVTGTALAGTSHRPRWICRQSNDPRREMPWPFSLWARRSLARADRVVGCSAGVVGATREYLRLPAEKMVHLDNVADIARIRELADRELPIERKPGAFAVVHAGRLYKQKNQRLLLEAFSRLRGRPAELWILGRGGLEGELRRRAAALGIGDQVRFLGFQDNPFPFFRAADCLALSSDWEGLPNVVIEAMICGTPAVATRCPFGPEELIEDGRTGLLVPTGDPEAFGTVLARLAERPAEAEALGREARRRAEERFALEKVVGAYERLFLETFETADRGATRISGEPGEVPPESREVPAESRRGASRTG